MRLILKLSIQQTKQKRKLEKKIPDVTEFVKKTKLTVLENKSPDDSSLAAKAALTVVEKKIPNVSGLVKKNKL